MTTNKDNSNQADDAKKTNKAQQKTDQTMKKDGGKAKDKQDGQKPQQAQDKRLPAGRNEK